MEENISRPPIKVLHVLAKSYPSLNGYSVRSHEIIKAQKKMGSVSPIVITSPFYPEILEMGEYVEIDGIPYNRTFPNQKKVLMPNWGNFPRLLKFILYPVRRFEDLIRERRLMKEFQAEIENISLEDNPDILHAHTPFKVGIPTMRAARKMGKPFIYEVRGFWEESAIARGRFSKWNPRYWRFRFMETKTMRGAEVVFCLSKTMKYELMRRGVKEEKISIIRNGAPSDYLEGGEEKKSFEGEENNDSLLAIKNIKKSNKIIGYVGSIQVYEGLENLIEVIEMMVGDGKRVHLLVVSNDENKSFLEDICLEKNINIHVSIIGPVSRDDIRSYYEQIDVIVIPRDSDSKMANVVTPLKPMESLALGIPLIISDTPAIRELVGEGTATLFDSSNTSELYEKLDSVLQNKDEAAKKVELGIEWIRRNGTWDVSAAKTLVEYNLLLGNKY